MLSGKHRNTCSPSASADNLYLDLGYVNKRTVLCYSLFTAEYMVSSVANERTAFVIFVVVLCNANYSVSINSLLLF